MKLSVLYRTTEGPWGGGNSFLRSLKLAWESWGIEVVNNLQSDLDGVLINSSYLGAMGHARILTSEKAQRLVTGGFIHPLPAVLGFSRWRKQGQRPPFVHRLDGVFRLYGRDAGDPADTAQIGINQNMDWTIYQSEYCRQSFANEGLDTKRSDVIFNGVDTSRFYPADDVPPFEPFKLVSLAWSPNIRKGAPQAVEASRLAGVEVTFIGRWPDTLDPEGVNVIPPVSHQELPELLRQHHVMLHMAQHDPCSNAILEGMASGLPVVFHPSGGSPEIVGDRGLAGDKDLGRAIEVVREHYSEFRERVLAYRHNLSIELVARRYLDVFSKLGPILL